MGQVYRWDPAHQRCSHQEPSPAQLAWMLDLYRLGVYHAPAAGLPWHRRPLEPPLGQARLQVMRACQDRGWVRSWPGRPEYMLGYYTAAWALTKAGRAEVEHQRSRRVLAVSLQIPAHPRLAKLLDPDFGSTE